MYNDQRLPIVCRVVLLGRSCAFVLYHRFVCCTRTCIMLHMSARVYQLVHDMHVCCNIADLQ